MWASAISGDNLVGVKQAFAHGEEWVFGCDTHSGGFALVIFEREPNQVNDLARHHGGYGEDARDVGFLVAGDEYVAFAEGFGDCFALGC
ncbi:MAG: hypothetical protein ABJN14_15450 [Paracoccaceae bacterium]